mmetsp:Transcript_20031/g.62976  ORF Transcript_20031/g.62976 Transcript_20031/m.62976 type:complete len:135 (-) Transcript_20031:209-613(-)
MCRRTRAALLLLCAASAHALVVPPAMERSFAVQSSIAPLEPEVVVKPMSPDIEKRVLEAQEKVEAARLEFEREKRVKERQRKKQLFDTIARGRFRRTAQAFGYEDEELVVAKDGQASFEEATPDWVKRLFKTRA